MVGATVSGDRVLAITVTIAVACPSVVAVSHLFAYTSCPKLSLATSNSSASSPKSAFAIAVSFAQ